VTRKGYFLLALVLAGPGCISPPAHVEEQAHKIPVPPQAAPVAEPPPAVTADEVTEANASEKAGALARELDFAANERPGEPPAAPAKAGSTKP
jgi:hypothetical protein